MGTSLKRPWVVHRSHETRLLTSWLASLKADEWSGSATEFSDALLDHAADAKLYGGWFSAKGASRVVEQILDAINAVGWDVEFWRTNAARMICFVRRDPLTTLTTWLAKLPSGGWKGGASALACALGRPAAGLAIWLSEHTTEIRRAGFVVGFSVKRPVVIRFSRIEEPAP